MAATMVSLPTRVGPHVPIYVPAIDNYVLLPPNEYSTFAVAIPYDARILPSPLHEGIRACELFQNERQRQVTGTSCVFIALPQKGEGDGYLISRLSWSAGFALTFNGFVWVCMGLYGFV